MPQCFSPLVEYARARRRVMTIWEMSDADGVLHESGGHSLSLHFVVDDSSRVGEVRRAAESLGARAGLDATEVGALALVVTEMATNLARHAEAGGHILLTLRDDSVRGVDAIALDRGPGIADVSGAMADGFSSAGTPGHGLGAIKRMSSEFGLYTRRGANQGNGTIVLGRVARKGVARAEEPRFLLGAVCVPHPGERVSGDSWTAISISPAVTLVALVDGLGHGESAAEAAREAMRVIRSAPERSPAAHVDAAHGALRATRGAALAVAQVDLARRSVNFAGVGNISATLQSASASARGMTSHNGTVGHVMRKAHPFMYEWPAGGTLVMHTDGINTHWRMDQYPGIDGLDPAILAAALYRDHTRGRDDATVVTFRERMA